MNKNSKYILILVGIVFIVFLLGGLGNPIKEKTTSNATSQTLEQPNISAPSVIQATTSGYNITRNNTSLIPVAKETQPENITKYQDTAWRTKVQVWAPVISSGLKTLGNSMTNMEFDRIGNDASILESSCRLALKDSKKFTVSSELLDIKNEYESSLSDYIKAAEQTQFAMEKINSNNMDAATKYLKTANAYMQSGQAHMSNADAAAQ